MKNIVNIKETKLKVEKSKNTNIGNINNDADEKNEERDSTNDVAAIIKKTGNIDKVLVIVFIIAVIALVVVLKNI